MERMNFVKVCLILLSAAVWGQSGCVFLDNMGAAAATSIDLPVKMICITCYSVEGDAPPRWMVRLSTAPNPVQPWHVKTDDGSYWQDAGGEFYPEFLGATVDNDDCSTALEQAFRAHMFLKMRLRGMGNTYKCRKQVNFDTFGFSNGGCDVDFNGMGRSCISFAPDVPAPCFFLGSSQTQNNFWGRFVNLEIDANVDGVAAQFGRTDLQDPTNDFVITVNVTNASTGGGAQAIVLNAIYSSLLNIVGNCGATGSGLAAIQLNRCNMCRGFLAPGHCNQGLVFANYCNGNSFSIDIEVLETGLVQADNTCAYNEIVGGVIANSSVGIDNHKGGPLRLRNVLIGGVTSLLSNPNAQDASWGGYGVTIDDSGQNPTGFSMPSMPGGGVWVLNKSCQPQWIAISGTSGSDSFQVRVRSWYDFSSEGTIVASGAPCGFVLQPGEQVCYSGSGASLSWTWWPLL